LKASETKLKITHITTPKLGVIPSCIGSAAESRVSYQLSKGNIEVAKQVSNRCMFLTGITSVVGTSVLVFCFNVIYFVTSDNDLENMLMGVMPYILLCQPMISLTTTGAYLNRALAMYQRSTKIELLVTCLVTLPLAGVSTFVFGYNISGLAAALFIGYATTGLVILAIYHNADWEKAVRKNKKIAGEVESSKLNTGVDTMDTQEDANNSSFNSAEMVGVLV
jgi:Na+-driven multidrug efflux pump